APGEWRAVLREIAFASLLLVAAAGLAWASRQAYVQRDWTTNAAHTLRPASASVLARAEGTLRITAYAGEDGVVRGAVRVLVDRYRQLKSDIELDFVDPRAVPDEAQRLNIGPHPELLLSLGGRSEHVRELNERSVSSALARLVKGHERWVAVLTGHGERAADGNGNADLGALAAELERVGYRVRPLNLANTEAVPDNTSMLVLTEPRAPWRPEEVARVEHYVANGGNLLWLADPASPPALPWLSQRLGLSFGPGVVVDPTSANPGIVVASGYSSHPAVSGLHANTVFPLVTPIVWERPDGFTTAGLVSTGLRPWAETGPLDDALRFDQDSDVAGPLDIAVAMSSTGSSERKPGASEQRIAVFGDGDFLSNAFLGQGANLPLALNVVSWLVGADSLIDIPPRDTVDARFEPGVRARWLIALGPPVALPLLLLGVGAWIWRRRKRL
ncbi:MAG: GldG family protein, partial [Gammaproteobacteria bacterium]